MSKTNLFLAALTVVIYVAHSISDRPAPLDAPAWRFYIWQAADAIAFLTPNGVGLLKIPGAPSNAGVLAAFDRLAKSRLKGPVKNLGETVISDLQYNEFRAERSEKGSADETPHV